MGCLSQPFRKARSTNATDTSFPSKVPTITEPSGGGVLDLTEGGQGLVPESLVVLPFGTGDDNDVFDMRVIGWRRIVGGPNPGDILWVPCIIAQVTATLSAAVGVAGAPVVATERFADTLAVTVEGVTRDGELTAADAETFTSSGTTVITSPANDTPAFFEVCVKGFEKIEFTFDTTTGDPTGANALVAAY